MQGVWNLGFGPPAGGWDLGLGIWNLILGHTLHKSGKYEVAYAMVDIFKKSRHNLG